MSVVRETGLRIRAANGQLAVLFVGASRPARVDRESVQRHGLPAHFGSKLMRPAITQWSRRSVALLVRVAMPEVALVAPAHATAMPEYLTAFSTSELQPYENQPDVR